MAGHGRDRIGGDAPAAGGKTPAVQAAPHGVYAGTQTCLSCHEDRGGVLKTGPHARAYQAGGPVAPFGCQQCHGDTKANLGCESCHGPGKAHADAGGDKTKIVRFAGLSPKDASADVHRPATRARSTRCGAGSQHDQRNVGLHRPATACTRRRARPC